MSYQPGISMPKFYKFRMVSLAMWDLLLVEPYHGDRNVWRVREDEFDLIKLLTSSPILGQ